MCVHVHHRCMQRPMMANVFVPWRRSRIRTGHLLLSINAFEKIWKLYFFFAAAFWLSSVLGPQMDEEKWWWYVCFERPKNDPNWVRYNLYAAVLSLHFLFSSSLSVFVCENNNQKYRAQTLGGNFSERWASIWVVHNFQFIQRVV